LLHVEPDYGIYVNYLMVSIVIRGQFFD